MFVCLSSLWLQFLHFRLTPVAGFQLESQSGLKFKTELIAYLKHVAPRTSAAQLGLTIWKLSLSQTPAWNKVSTHVV